MTITPLLYETFIRRAEKRMLNLYDKMKNAPFLVQHGINAADYLQPLEGPAEPELALTNSIAPVGVWLTRVNAAQPVQHAHQV